MGNFFFILSPKIYSIQDKMSIKKITKLNLIFINNFQYYLIIILFYIWPNYNLQTKQQIKVIAFIHQIRKE